MFIHVFKYRLKCILRDKENMFWTLLFPLILATFFNLAFSNLTQGEFFETIPIAIIENEGYTENENIKLVLNSVSDNTNSEKPLFSYVITDVENAKSMLDENKISGYVDLQGEIDITVKYSGLNQTIIKEFFDRYLQTGSMVTRIISESDNPAEASGRVMEFLNADFEIFATQDTKSAAFPDFTVIFFYSLIGMACFYGAFTGIKEVSAIQANNSTEAIRLNVSPVKKLYTFLASAGAASLIQVTSIFILLIYLKYFLNIDFGNNLLLLVVLCIAGSICGVSYGTMIASLLTVKEGIMTAIVIGSTMTFSFLAGMMQPPVKYMITQAVPAMAYLNPVNVITDALYSLYYYDTYERYFINLAIILAFILIFGSITVFKLRRLKYASI